MKEFGKNLLFTIMVLIATGSAAQEGPRRQRPPREFNPEEFAARQTYALHRALQLDSIQFQAIMLMNYADAVTMQDSMKVRREHREKMRASGESLKRQQPSEEERKARMELEKQRREIKNRQMKQILNAEQYNKYLKLQEEDSERKRNRREGQGRMRREGRVPKF